VDDSIKRRAIALWNEALQHQMRGEFEDAIALYTKSIELCPTAEAHTYRGWTYSMLGRVDEAIAECKRAIAVDPSFGNPYNDIGAYLIAKGEFDAAIEWLEKAQRAPRYEPRHYPHMNLGRVYAAKGMVKQAIAEFEQALSFAPDDPTCRDAIFRLQAMLN
jgi:Tfp pilus assembly protein PilF